MLLEYKWEKIRYTFKKHPGDQYNIATKKLFEIRLQQKYSYT